MADQGFPASRRLLTSSEFDMVFRKNHIKVSTPEFLFLVAKSQGKQCRLGMVVSKKNTSHAVDRNQLKRLIREVFRKTDIPSVDIVVLTRTGANKQPNRVLANILERSFKKIATQINSRINKEVT